MCRSDTVAEPRHDRLWRLLDTLPVLRFSEDLGEAEAAKVPGGAVGAMRSTFDRPDRTDARGGYIVILTYPSVPASRSSIDAVGDLCHLVSSTRYKGDAMSARATVHAVGLVVGLAGGYSLAVSGGSAIAPPAFAGSFLVAVVLGQLGRARPELVSDQQPGLTASLRVRRMRDYVPKSLARAALACAIVAIGGLGTILALGRFAKDLPDGYYADNFGGPFGESGRFGGIGIVGLMVSTWVTVTATVIIGAFSLWLVARSPRVVGDADLIRRDERWRQEVATTVTAAVGWVTAVPVAAVAFALALVMTDWDPGGALPVVPALVGSVAVLLAVRFAARLVDEPPRLPQSSMSPLPVTGPVTGSALEVLPEAAVGSPQWTGVRG